MAIEAHEMPNINLAEVLNGIRRALVYGGPPQNTPGDHIEIRSLSHLVSAKATIKGISVKSVKDLNLGDALAAGCTSVDELVGTLGEDEKSATVAYFELVERD